MVAGSRYNVWSHISPYNIEVYIDGSNIRFYMYVVYKNFKYTKHFALDLDMNTKYNITYFLENDKFANVSL